MKMTIGGKPVTRAEMESKIGAYLASLTPEKRDRIRFLLHRGLDVSIAVRDTLQVALDALGKRDVVAAKAAMDLVRPRSDERRRLMAELFKMEAEISIEFFAGQDLDTAERTIVAGLDALVILQDQGVSAQLLGLMSRIGPENDEFRQYWVPIAKSAEAVTATEDGYTSKEHLIEYIRMLCAHQFAREKPDLVIPRGSPQQAYKDLALDLGKLHTALTTFFNTHVNTKFVLPSDTPIVHTDTGEHKLMTQEVLAKLIDGGYVRRDGAGFVCTEADLARAVENGVGVCDFCSGDVIARAYHVPSFTMATQASQRIAVGGAVGSDGAWAACAGCAELIQKRDADGLRERAVNAIITSGRLRARYGPITRETRAAAAEAIQQVQNQFWLGLIAARDPADQVEDYADGISDVKARIIHGATMTPTPSGAQFAQLLADLDLMKAKFERHEYTVADMAEVKRYLEATVVTVKAENHAKLTALDDLRRAVLRPIAIPAHIDALEQQWQSYKFNKAMNAAMEATSTQHGALHNATVLALRTAETYCWAPDTTEAVIGVGQGIPDDVAISPTAIGDLAAPGRAGWWWFQQPVPVKTTSLGGEVEPVVALLWKREYPPHHPARLWMSTFVMQTITKGGVTTQVAVPTAAFLWDDHVTLGALPGALRAGYAEEYRGRHKNVEGYDAASMEETVEASVWCARFFMAAAMWLRQKIVVESHGAESVRAATKRIQREHKLPERPRVRVIELRRAERQMLARAHAATGTQVGTGRKLTCRFVVGGLFGHTRNQWHPSTKTHAPKWIAPYWKGPEDAPVKAGSTVYAVRR